MQPDIIVVGSLNMDITVQVGRIPTLGETVLGGDLAMVAGGKGGNQAFAAAKLGREVAMVGKVGENGFGSELRQSLFGVGVDVTCVLEEPGVSSGVALICVEPSGNNAIAVAPGANHLLRPSDVDCADRFLATGRLLLIQLEIPMDTVLYALKKAKLRGMTTILDPAPAVALPTGTLQWVDILTPNETEAAILLDEEPASMSVPQAEQAAIALQQCGATTVILKLGEKGAWLAGPGNLRRHYPAYRVHAVDTTAAGDVFNGALAVALSEGKREDDAIWFANAAAALSTTRPGAQASTPDRREVEQFLTREKPLWGER